MRTVAPARSRAPCAGATIPTAPGRVLLTMRRALPCLHAEHPGGPPLDHLVVVVGPPGGVEAELLAQLLRPGGENGQARLGDILERFLVDEAVRDQQALARLRDRQGHEGRKL